MTVENMEQGYVMIPSLTIWGIQCLVWSLEVLHMYCYKDQCFVLPKGQNDDEYNSNWRLMPKEFCPTRIIQVNWGSQMPKEICPIMDWFPLGFSPRRNFRMWLSQLQRINELQLTDRRYPWGRGETSKIKVQVPKEIFPISRVNT